jgi:hypothetical protein
MFNRPYDFELIEYKENWWLAKIQLPDTTILRAHIKKIKKPILGLKDPQYELLFDRSVFDSERRGKEIHLNGLGDAFRIYATMYEIGVYFVFNVIKENFSLFCWQVTDEKTTRVYEILGKKFQKDLRFKNEYFFLHYPLKKKCICTLRKDELFSINTEKYNYEIL